MHSSDAKNRAGKRTENGNAQIGGLIGRTTTPSGNSGRTNFSTNGTTNKNGTRPKRNALTTRNLLTLAPNRRQKEPMEVEEWHKADSTTAKEWRQSLLDIEDILSSRQIARSEIRCPNMPPQRLREMLERDVQLRTAKKPLPFLGGKAFEWQPNECVGETERELIRWYERDYAVIGHKWDELSAEANARRANILRINLAKELAPQIYGNDEAIGGQQPSNVPPLGGPRRDKTATVAEEGTMGEQKADEWRAMARAKDRGRVIANLIEPETENDMENDNEAKFSSCWAGQNRLSVTFGKASFDPPIDTLFISAALYDVRQRRKVSEDFCFCSTAKHSPRALFSVPQDSDEKCAADSLVLAFRLEKALQRGGLDAALEPFSKRQMQNLKVRNLPSMAAAVNSSNSFQSNGCTKFRQQIGLVAVPLARTVTSALDTCDESGRSQLGAGGGRPFTDSMVQVSSMALDMETNGTGQGVAKLGEDSISECSTSTSAERFSCSAAIPPPAISVPARLANSASWTLISTPSATVGYHSHHVPTQPGGIGWVHRLSERPISVRINSFIRSEPLPDTELFDWFASITLGHQQPRGDKIPVDIRFALEIVRLDEMSAQNVRVLSSELAQLNLAASPSFGIASPSMFDSADGTESAIPSVCIDLLPFPISRMASVHTFPRHLLFVYPRSANFTARTGQNARNISVKVELFNGSEGKRIDEAFVVDGEFVGEVFSTVQYHSRHAQFGGTEWKLIMPWGCKEGLYLRFTFLHISCKPRGDGTKTMGETPIGFSWLPLKLADSDSALPSGDHRLPISLNVPPPALCLLSPHANVPDVHWLDSHRPLFHLSVLPVSSVQPQDLHLNTFLLSSRAFLRLRPLSSLLSVQSPPALATSIRNVLKCRPEQLLSFLHIILHRLLAIITVNSSCEASDLIAKSAFETLCQLAIISSMLLERRVDARNRSRLLLEFVQLERLPQHTFGEDKLQQEEEEHIWQKREQCQDEQQKETPRGPNIATDEKRPGARSAAEVAFLHQQLVRLFISSSGHARDSACTSSWFLLSLIHRSLVEHLDQTQGHLLPRKMRFGGADFLAQLSQLGESLIADVLERVPKNAAQAGAINLAWAQFLRDSVALLSRGWIIEQMKRYCETIDARIDVVIRSGGASNLGPFVRLKMSLFRVLLSQQHFLFLCLPFPVELSAAVAEENDKKIKPNLLGASSSPAGTFRKSTTNLATNRKKSSPKVTNGTKDANLLMAKSVISLPPPSSSSASSFLSVGWHPPRLFADLSAEHRLRHFPIFLFLSQLHELLRARCSLCVPFVSLLHSLVAAHENDWRLSSDNGELRHRVAVMYSPLLSIVLELEMDRLDMNLPDKDGISDGGGMTTEEDKDSGLATSEEEQRSSRTGGNNATTATNSSNNRGQAGTTQKKLLLCVCWLLRSVAVPSLLAHLRQLSPVQLRRFVHLLRSLLFTFAQLSPSAFPRRHSVDSFVHLIGGIQLCHGTDGYDFQQQFLPSVKRRPSVETSSTSTSGDSNAIVPKSNDNLGTTAEGMDNNNNNNNTTNASSTSQIRWRVRRHNGSADQQLEKTLCHHLSAEVLLLVLDQLELLFQLASPQLLPELLRLVLSMLAGHHSVQSLLHLFRTLRAFVRKFADFLLVDTDQQLLTALCQQLLRHMTSSLAEVRQQSATSTLALLKIAFRHSKRGFVRLNRCLTTALCSLVSTCVASGKALDDNALGASLESMMPEAKRSEKTEFVTQLEHLVGNLNAILSDTFKLSAQIDDFEMTVDLMHRIAHGYRNNPELRIAWLLGIARKHLEERKTYAEAAQCFLHCCAIVATSLLSNGTADDELLPRSMFDAFEELSENIREEWEGKRGDVARGDERRTDALVAGGHFTLAAFTKMVDKMANLFERAQMFELVANVFKLVLPLFERTHSHVKLIQAHTQIVSCLSRIDPPALFDDMENAAETTASANGTEAALIVPMSGTDKRCFGTYFRVRFYGAKFDELNDKEFVYKEPAITKLAEISARLENFYVQKLGPETVVMMKDSNEVDIVGLNPDKAYIQITFVEPHFERWERRRRQTHLERNYRLRQFVYATPFTQNGKAHGQLKEQWKRKTMLGLEKSFPYVKTRLRVIERRQTVLCPIEVAIEDIQKRTRELRWAMLSEPRDLKMLQMQLQGCIGTTVNQGPIEIARVFLDNANLGDDGMPREGSQRRLRLCFDKLSQACNDALEVNERYMEAGREEYKCELRRNMCHFEESLAKILKNVGEVPSISVPSSSGSAPSPAELVQALAIAGKIGPVSSV